MKTREYGYLVIMVSIGLFVHSIVCKAERVIEIPGQYAVTETVICECDIDEDGVPEQVQVTVLRCQGDGPYCIRIFLREPGVLARAELYDDGQIVETKQGVYCGPGPSGDPNVDAYFKEIE